MKGLNTVVFFTLLFAAGNVFAGGLYVESGLAYNPDAYGITSNTLARVALIYRTALGSKWEVDFSAEHESDPYNSGNDDLISHEAYGIKLRSKIW